MIKSILKHLILLTLLGALSACASMADRLSCNEEVLIGTWKADWRLEIWTFEPDGTLQCEGLCNYGAEFGYPERWEGDESANLWSGGVEYLKLHFTEFTFEGTEGAFRCDVNEEATLLILDPIAGPPFTFTRFEAE